jgi:uncharacterized protein (DUF885 family)
VRHLFAVITLSCAVLQSCAHVSSQPPRTSRELVDAYAAAYAERFPDVAAPHFFDNSLAAHRAWTTLQSEFESAAKARTDGDVDLSALIEHLESNRELTVCRRELWNLSPLTGWLPEYIRMFGQQPVGSAAERQIALAKWQDFDRFVSNEISNLREGLERGYVAPERYVRGTLAYLDRVLQAPPAASPLLAPARRSEDSVFAGAWRALVTREITPSLTGLRDFLRDEYLPRARASAGLHGLPNGIACYEALVRRYATEKLTYLQLDTLGRSLLADGLRRRAARGAQVVADTTAFAQPERVLAHADSLLRAAWHKAPAWFGALPDAPLPTIRAMDDADPSGPSGIYLPASGADAPVITLNMAALRGPSAALYLDRLIFHEGVPGHHLQKVVSARSSSRPFLSSAAFIEGWAVYASNLADEMGLYTSEVARTPFIDAAVDDGLTLLIQNGLHVHAWSAEQAVDTLLKYSDVPREEAAAQIDYFIAAPAHALAYPLGARGIERLRREAAATLGSRFDIRAFHTVVLEHGAVPMGVLRQIVEKWIAEARR